MKEKSEAKPESELLQSGNTSNGSSARGIIKCCFLRELLFRRLITCMSDSFRAGDLAAVNVLSSFQEESGTSSRKTVN